MTRSNAIMGHEIMSVVQLNRLAAVTGSTIDVNVTIDTNESAFVDFPGFVLLTQVEVQHIS